MNNSNTCTIYTYEKKKKLAERISKIKRKQDMVQILNIICEKNNKKITENQNGVFLLFDKLDDETYQKIDNYLKTIVKKQQPNSDNQTLLSPTASDKLSENQFVNYTQQDEKFSNDVRYSNREKNIIKRQHFEKKIKDQKDKNSTVVYQNFNATMLESESSTSDKKISPVDKEITKPVKSKPGVKKRKNIENESKSDIIHLKKN